MANFGFRDLAVAEAYEPSWEEAKTSGVGADEVLAQAHAYPNLREAIADRTLVIGTSAGQRRSPEHERVTIEQARERIRPNDRVAVLFGSERTGLSNEELSYCHMIARINTVPGCPSMNLGQAVAICCYELSRGTIPVPGATRIKPANMRAMETLRERLYDVLRRAEYISGPPRPSDELKLRRLLWRLNISARDVATLSGMVAKLRWKLDTLEHRK
jgi:tRNA/rRNA methyltransferase